MQAGANNVSVLLVGLDGRLVLFIIKLCFLTLHINFL